MSQPTWSTVTTRAQSDSAFRSRLMADPVSACNEAGCSIPHGTEVQVIEQSPNQFHLMFGANGYSTEIDTMLDRAVNDAEYKAQLLSDPNSTLESVMGDKLPAGFEVVVHEKKPGQVFFFLDPIGACGELSEQELDAVAGGTLKGLLRKIGDFFCKDWSNGVANPQYDSNGNLTGIETHTDYSSGGYVTEIQT